MKNNKHTWRYEGRSCAMPQPLKRTPMFTYKPSNELLDEVNIRVLEELQRDPRLTMTELGRRVGMSSPAVTERVRRMDESGGYPSLTRHLHLEQHSYYRSHSARV